jgi:hypothetical protein
MPIQVISFIVTLLLPLAFTFSASAKCFDFSKKITSPLKDTKAPASGKTGEGITWAAVEGTVEKPISQVLKLLLDHNTTKSPSVDEMTVEENKDSPHFANHFVKFMVKTFIFKVSWTEQWAYEILAGSPEKPAKTLITYEKIDGTHYIPHLCGSVVLRKLSERSTGVYQYEEAKAERRSVEDTVKGLEGTLATLRK